ncbi:hypothetical protein P4O66_017074, partial [Electrophorus voltai]
DQFLDRLFPAGQTTEACVLGSLDTPPLICVAVFMVRRRSDSVSPPCRLGMAREVVFRALAVNDGGLILALFPLPCDLISSTPAACSSNAVTLPRVHRSAPAMPVDFSGRWLLESNENLDEYMKALNIDFATRKVAIHLSPAKVFFQEGDRFVIETFSAFRNYEACVSRQHVSRNDFPLRGTSPLPQTRLGKFHVTRVRVSLCSEEENLDTSEGLDRQSYG